MNEYTRRRKEEAQRELDEQDRMARSRTIRYHHDIDNIDDWYRAEIDMMRAMAIGAPVVHPDFIHKEGYMKLKKKYHQILNEYCSLLNTIEEMFGGLVTDRMGQTEDRDSEHSGYRTRSDNPKAGC